MTTATMSDWAARYCREDKQIHRYRTAELADPAVGWLVPAHSADLAHPERHGRADLSAQPEPGRGHYRLSCRACWTKT